VKVNILKSFEEGPLEVGKEKARDPAEL